MFLKNCGKLLFYGIIFKEILISGSRYVFQHWKAHGNQLQSKFLLNSVPYYCDIFMDLEFHILIHGLFFPCLY